MKTKICLSVALIVLISSNSWASATCKTWQSKVVINDSQSLTVSGLSSKGIENGIYSCQVLGVGPGYLSVQSQIHCQNQNTEFMAWMIEGSTVFGGKAASIALYVNGLKIFEAGCSRN